MKAKVVRRWLLFWCLFIGIGAVAGAIGMFVDISGKTLGMDAMLPYFQVLPFAEVVFQDFLFSGFALLIVNGLSNLLAAALLLRRKRLGTQLGTIFGFTLMLWIIIQFVIFPANFMSTTYFIFGILQCLTGHLLSIAEKQEAFHFDSADYPNVGSVSSALVVYFSRHGYCRKVAFERADALGADIAELTTPETTQGLSGFLWCGRFGMHGWSMPTNELRVDPADYDRVIVVAPIWVFNICSPMRGWLGEQHGRLKHVEYVIVHYQAAVRVQKAAETMDRLLGVKAERVDNLVCHCGTIVRSSELRPAVNA